MHKLIRNHYKGRQAKLADAIWHALAVANGEIFESLGNPPARILAEGFAYYWRDDEPKYIKWLLHGGGRRRHHRLMRRYSAALKQLGAKDLRSEIKII